jgi:hypothetical protein
VPHIALTTGALRRRRRPSARLAALVAVGVALALQVIPPFGSAQAAAPVAAPAGVVQTVTPIPGVDLQASITGPTQAVPLTTITDSILITNAGTDPATGVTFDLTAPPQGATYVVGAGATCTSSWVCTVADIPAGSQLGLTLQIHTAAPLGDGDLINPMLTVSTTAHDVDASNDVATAPTRLSDAGELTLTIARTTAAKILPGQRASFTITLTNHGPNVALAPEIFAHPLRAPASLAQTASASGASCAAAGTQGVWSCLWPSIPAGQSKTMTFAATSSVHLLAGTPFMVEAEAVSDNSVGAQGTAAASVIDNHSRSTDVSVTMYSTPKVKPNDLGHFRMTLANNGPYRAHDVVLTVTVPKGFSWKGLEAGASVAKHTRTLTQKLPSLEAGDSETLYGDFRYPAGAVLTWTTKVTHSDPDPKHKNNSDSASTRVLGPIVKAISTASTTSGTTVKTTTTSSSATSGTTGSDVIYNDAGQVVSGTAPTPAGEKLADTGGPALRLPVLGFMLLILGSVSTASARQRRPAPRHRAWVSPYA